MNIRYLGPFLLCCWLALIPKEGPSPVSTGVHNPHNRQAERKASTSQALEIDVELIEEARIGTDSTLPRNEEPILDFIVDREGLVYALYQGGEIRIFNPAGDLVRKFRNASRSEESAPFNTAKIRLDEQGRIFISNQKQVHVFDAKGVFQHTILFPFQIVDFNPARNGRIFAQIISEKKSNEVALLDQDGTCKAVFFTEARKPLKYLKDSQGGTAAFSGDEHGFGWRLYFSPWEQGGAVFGSSGESRVFILDSDATSSRSFRHGEPPEAISPEEKSNSLKTLAKPDFRGAFVKQKDLATVLEFPPYKPFFQFLHGDGDGSVYCGRFVRPGSWSIDVFDRKGTLKKRLRLKFKPFNKIMKSKFYGFDSSFRRSIIRYGLSSYLR